ncbi:MAG: hypothetical protein IKN38_05835 [Clostridia bacterium]|nr:hypothetical protein [Clostridia bacterium]
MKKKKKIDELEITEEERKTQDMSAVAEYNGEKSNRAKLVEYEGDDYEDIPVKDDSISGKTSNFFYHNKWNVIISSVVIIIVVIVLYQMLTRDKAKADISVLYAGPREISAAEAEQIKFSLGEIFSIGSDTKKNVYLYTSYYSAGEVRTDASGREYTLTDKGYADEKLQGLIATGECGVMFVDRAFFDILKSEGGLETFSDGLGFTPDGAFDEYGIELKDTEAYLYYAELRCMPKDTVVCLRAPSESVLTSRSEAQKNHDGAVKLLTNFFKFNAPEPVEGQ